MAVIRIKKGEFIFSLKSIVFIKFKLRITLKKARVNRKFPHFFKSGKWISILEIKAPGIDGVLISSLIVFFNPY